MGGRWVGEPRPPLRGASSPRGPFAACPGPVPTFPGPERDRRVPAGPNSKPSAASGQEQENLDANGGSLRWRVTSAESLCYPHQPLLFRASFGCFHPDL